MGLLGILALLLIGSLILIGLVIVIALIFAIAIGILYIMAKLVWIGAEWLKKIRI